MIKPNPASDPASDPAPALAPAPDPAPPACLTVFYDGDCPLCRREIALYQDLKPSEPLAWLDVSDTAATALPASRPALMQRFHVQLPDGRLLSGARAFVALWAVLPGWRWLGKVGTVPGASTLLELVYRAFLCVRPQLQRIARRLL